MKVIQNYMYAQCEDECIIREVNAISKLQRPGESQLYVILDNKINVCQQVL